MTRKITSLAIVAVLAGAGFATMAPTSANATASCASGNGYYKTHAWPTVRPDLTPTLEAGLVKATGVKDIHDVYTRPTLGSDDVIAARIVLTTALNGSTGKTGFTGAVGNAFYALADYFEGERVLTKEQLHKAAELLEHYNDGRLGLVAC
jgi:hypothetical protein